MLLAVGTSNKTRESKQVAVYHIGALQTSPEKHKKV